MSAPLAWVHWHHANQQLQVLDGPVQPRQGEYLAVIIRADEYAALTDAEAAVKRAATFLYPGVFSRNAAGVQAECLNRVRPIVLAALGITE